MSCANMFISTGLSLVCSSILAHTAARCPRCGLFLRIRLAVPRSVCNVRVCLSVTTASAAKTEHVDRDAV